MSVDTAPLPGFNELSLIGPVLKALDDVGYETPSPIQARIIPHVLAGRDVIGQAQTGTGKTAAFAMPLLSRIDLGKAHPQVLVLTPTRELAIQVAEAFQRYAAHMKGFHVLPIYGGQEYSGQLRQLKRGAHVVVGTPGRVMDHMRRKTLKLDALICIVLDEADEMLRMGFIEDVEWILEQTPSGRQVALFSATMPAPIRRIAQKHLSDPVEVISQVHTTSVDAIRQYYWIVNGPQKLDVLTRILETASFDGVLVFVRTKTSTLELAEKLQARGYSCAALNGDISQKQREHTVKQIKSGKLDILVATDVAARGLDITRISHVINFDIPNDTESYVHRIGRTGRAGRSGEAILFVTPREKHLLHAMEKVTKQKIRQLVLPSTEAINDQRIARFKQRITDTLAAGDMVFFSKLIEQYQKECDIPVLDIAAALAKLVQGNDPLLLTGKPEKEKSESIDRQDRGRKGARPARRRDTSKPGEDMQRYRLEVGKQHGVKAGNIVGAIANEAGLESQFIRQLTIHEDYSTVVLPEGMPRDVFQALKKTWVAGQQLNISVLDEPGKHQERNKKRKHKPKGKGPKDRKE